MDTVTRLKLAARDPLGQALPRCADAAPMADLRAPQRHINAAQIEADERAESWLARNGLRVMAALMLLVFVAVTAARAGDYVARKTAADLRWYHQLEAMQ